MPHSKINKGIHYFKLNQGIFFTVAVYRIFSEASFNLSLKTSRKFFTDRIDIITSRA